MPGSEDMKRGQHKVEPKSPLVRRWILVAAAVAVAAFMARTTLFRARSAPHQWLRQKIDAMVTRLEPRGERPD